jgi:hypothetical protein
MQHRYKGGCIVLHFSPAKNPGRLYFNLLELARNDKRFLYVMDVAQV